MRTFCPVLRFARSISACHAVKPTRPLSAAAQQSVFDVANVALNIAGGYSVKQAAAARQAFLGASLLMVLFSGIGVLAALYVLKTVVRPIAKISDTMRLVANGDLALAIP